MKKLVYLVVISLVVMYSCSVSNNEQANPLEDAIAAYQAQDYNESQKLCENIVNSDNLSTLTAHQLCDLSLLFFQLGSYNDYDANVVLAMSTLDKALQSDTTAVTEFLGGLSREDFSQFLTLLTILDGSKASIDEYLLEEDEFSQDFEY